MDKDTTWKQILDKIKSQITSANFRTWFQNTDISSLTDSEITLAVPSAFIKDQLLNRYEKTIKDSIQDVLQKDLKLSLTVDPTLSQRKQPSDSLHEEEDFFSYSTPKPQTNITLNPKYILENFVVGPTNNLAYAAAQAIVQNPGSSYNPLFIYGPSGVGKTHLMQAIGNALLKKNAYLKLIYASSERFMNDFVESIQTKKTGDFRSKYRSADIFLIDDVQFLAGKDSTQEEFFHTFNDLHTRNTQIILTSDRPPNDMQKLESRLVSRFQGGLMVDVQLPDFETRIAILKAKLTEKGESLDEQFLSLIAQSVDSNTRELEGKLIQILQISKLRGQSLSIDEVKNMLGRSSQNASHKLDHKKVISGINQYFNIKMTDLTGPRRQKELVLPRQICMFIMYTDCELPLEKIGQLLGGRDHTTIMHGVDKIKEAINRDREVQRLVLEVKQHITT